MKKLLSLLLTLCVLVCGYSWILNTKSQNEQYIQSPGVPYLFKFQANPEGRDFTSFLQQEADANNVDFLLTYVGVEDVFGKNAQVTSGVFSNSDWKVFEKDLISGRLPENPSEFLASFDTGSPRQSGLIYDFMNSSPVIIQSLADPVINVSPSGIYSVTGTSLDPNDFINRAASFLDTTPEEMTKLPYRFAAESSLAKVMTGISIILLILFTGISLYYPYTKIRKISVLKLEGWSTFSIWQELMKGVYILPLLLIICGGIGFALLYPTTRFSFYLGFIGLPLLAIIVSALLSWTMLWIVLRMPLTQLLKGKIHGKFALSLAFIIQLMILVIICFCIPAVALTVSRIPGIVFGINEVQKQARTLTLTRFEYIGDQWQQSLQGNDVLADKFLPVFLELEKKADAGYVNSYGVYTDDAGSISPPGNGTYQGVEITVNENYYRSHLEKLTGIPADEVFSQNETTILAYKDINQTVLEHAKTGYENAAVIEYSQPLTCFSDSVDLASLGHVEVKNPVIICENNNEIQAHPGMLLNSQEQNPIRIPDTPENVQIIQNLLDRAGLQENKFKFGPLKTDVYEPYLAQMSQTVFMWSAILLVFVFSWICALWFLLQMIVLLESQRIAAGRLLGHSLTSLFHPEVYGGIFELVLSAVIGFFAGWDGWGWLVWTFVWILLGVFSLLLIRGFTNKTVSRILKGDLA